MDVGRLAVPLPPPDPLAVPDDVVAVVDEVNSSRVTIVSFNFGIFFKKFEKTLAGAREKTFVVRFGLRRHTDTTQKREARKLKKERKEKVEVEEASPVFEQKAEYDRSGERRGAFIAATLTSPTTEQVQEFVHFACLVCVWGRGSST